MKYRIAIIESDEGFCVWVPALPGCCSQGRTRQEAEANIRQAIREYLDVPIDPIEGAEIAEIEVVL